MSIGRRSLLLSSFAVASAVVAGGLLWASNARALSADLDTMMMVEHISPGTNAMGSLRFTGRAGPLGRYPSDNGVVEPRSLFPNPADPFGINDQLALGEEGYALEVQDRGRGQVAPGPNDEPWALNMIPFGVALDGVILDPSGPWYDGGVPDPNNAFDNKCSGWEYEVMHPTVSRIVGVPDAIAGHVQPSGMFHYHGYPRMLTALLRKRHGKTGALLVGFSADGYPVTDYRATQTNGDIESFFFSGYILRSGKRRALDLTNPDFTPSGLYDGLFVQDYAFDPEAKSDLIRRTLISGGDYHGLTAAKLNAGKARISLLDERNGIQADATYRVSDYPAKVWHYVLTPDWPYIPRFFAFEPAGSFADIIPKSRRNRLYTNCPADLAGIRVGKGRTPY